MKLIHGDCLEEMKALADNSVDSVVTDPPYGLSFMGKKWDYDVPSVEVWKECLRVLKPGGHALIACGTRTQHRMAVNIEDAGFEIRDLVAWVYGSGFPKSLNIGKAVDKLQGNEREVTGINRAGSKERKGYKGDMAIMPHKSKTIDLTTTKGNSPHEGWGTALKPAMELWTLCRKPLSEKTVASNVLKWGTGGINIDGCRVGFADSKDKEKNNKSIESYKGIKTSADNSWKNSSPLEKANPQNERGRFPANFIHDGSDEVVRKFPNVGRGNGGRPYSYAGKEYNNKDTSMFNGDKPQAPSNFNDSGSASRFFYVAKASKAERNRGLGGFDEKLKSGTEFRPSYLERFEETGDRGSPRARFGKMLNNHPTVKPVKLMEYLVRLITPKGGTVLDPFMGSGTTGMACKSERFNFIGIELDEDYFKIAKKRIEQHKVQIPLEGK